MLNAERDSLSIWDRADTDVSVCLEGLSDAAMAWASGLGDPSMPVEAPSLSYSLQPNDVHNAVSLASKWSLERLKSNGNPVYDREQIQQLLDVAYVYWTVTNSLSAVEQGYHCINRSRVSGAFTIAPMNLELECLDSLLLGRAVLPPDPAVMEEVEAGIHEWFSSEHPTAAQQERFRNSVLLLSGHQVLGQTPLAPDAMDLGGLKLKEARDLSLAMLFLSMNDYLESKRVGAGSLCKLEDAPGQAAQWLHERTGIRKPACQRYVDLLTYPGVGDPNADLGVTPFFRLGDALYTSTALMWHWNGERNLLRRRLETSAGRQIGRLGEEAIGRLLQRIPRCEVAMNSPIQGTNGVVGELDVVSWDAQAGVGCVFEVKWTADVDGYSQVGRRDDVLADAQQKLAKVRSSIEGGSMEWPESLPDYASIDWGWIVVGMSGVPRKRKNLAGALTATSANVIEYLVDGPLPGASLAELLERVRRPRLPHGWKPGLVRESLEVEGVKIRCSYARPNFDLIDAAVGNLHEAIARSTAGGPGGGLIGMQFGPRGGRYDHLALGTLRRIPLDPSRAALVCRPVRAGSDDDV
ncbi:hypothetical protein, partial [Humibacillus xanthopallidus]|uniref:hypothetical protein n=1 Tax=Humibacillus xanthopallidus TaxID=412689 RepID=UPI0031DD8D2F